MATQTRKKNWSYDEITRATGTFISNRMATAGKLPDPVTRQSCIDQARTALELWLEITGLDCEIRDHEWLLTLVYPPRPDAPEAPSQDIR